MFTTSFQEFYTLARQMAKYTNNKKRITVLGRYRGRQVSVGLVQYFEGGYRSRMHRSTVTGDMWDISTRDTPNIILMEDGIKRNYAFYDSRLTLYGKRVTFIESVEFSGEKIWP